MQPAERLVKECILLGLFHGNSLSQHTLGFWINYCPHEIEYTNKNIKKNYCWNVQYFKCKEQSIQNLKTEGYEKNTYRHKALVGALKLMNPGTLADVNVREKIQIFEKLLKILKIVIEAWFLTVLSKKSCKILCKKQI